MTDQLTPDRQAFVDEALEGWEASIVCDYNSQIVQASEGAARLFGWSVGNLRGMTLPSLLPKRVYAFHANLVRKVIDEKQRMTGMGPAGRVLAGIHQSGRPFELELDRCWIPGSTLALVVMRVPTNETKTD